MSSQGSLRRSSSRAKHFWILKVNLLSISSRKGISFAGETQHTSTAPVNSGDNNYKFANGRAGETRKTRSVCLSVCWWGSDDELWAPRVVNLSANWRRNAPAKHKCKRKGSSKQFTRFAFGFWPFSFGKFIFYDRF